MNAANADEASILRFSEQEYAERLQRVRGEMKRQGFDLLYVTSPPNLYYLLGYESVWFDGRNATGLAITADSDPPLLFDTWDHASGWPPTVQDSVAIDYGGESFYFPKVLDAIKSTLQARRWLHGKVGIEWWSWAPGDPTKKELASRLAESATVADGSYVVDHVRLIKSPQELECVRKAAEIADRAMEAVRDAMQRGVTELELAALADYEMAKLGGEVPGIQTMVHSGPNSNHFHATSSRRQLASGDLVTVDFCGVYNRYHADLFRTFSLGKNPHWSDLLRRAEASVAHIVDRIRPGAPLVEVQRLMDAHIDSEGLREIVWWIGGYALGIGIPPDWVGHVYLNPAEAVEPFDFVPGYVTNYEHLFERRSAREGGGFIETLVMTDDGVQVMSRFPRTLCVV